MASEQARRENVTAKLDTVMKKDRVPKMATHFESLAGKSKEKQQRGIPFHGEKEADVQLSSTAERAATDTTVDTSKSGGGNVGEKAVAVESGKGVAEFVGKVAAEVKDQAVVAGWGTTQYTLEKVAEATKVVADMTVSVAEYSGEKAVLVKDKVAGAGKTAVSYAGEKIAAVKDSVVATEEKAAEHAARKKAEAQKDLEARRALYEMGYGGAETIASKEQDAASKTAAEKFLGLFQVEAEEQIQQQQQGGSILRAIAETIIEIGQTTKELLIGQYPLQVLEREDEAIVSEEHSPGAGKGT